jgi:F-type H+-transporting ATPase subunit gamma
MAERLADVVAQIQNVRQLESVVTAMRGIAASRAQRGRALLAGIDAYSRVVSRAIGHALSLMPADMPRSPSLLRGKLGLVLFCAEQGFAGAFSERVLDAAAGDVSSAVVLMIGTRGTIVAKERGLLPTWTAPMATHVDAIPAIANQIADALYGQIASTAIVRVDIVVSRSASGGGIYVDRHSLLPLDLTKFARPINEQPPLTTLSPHDLLERLTAEYVYAQLCEAAMHAFASENDARMMAMAAAKTNIGTKLTSLSQREQQLRQAEITTEIVELAAGAEASLRRR